MSKYNKIITLSILTTLIIVLSVVLMIHNKGFINKVIETNNTLDNNANNMDNNSSNVDINENLVIDEEITDNIIYETDDNNDVIKDDQTETDNSNDNIEDNNESDNEIPEGNTEDKPEENNDEEENNEEEIDTSWVAKNKAVAKEIEDLHQISVLYDQAAFYTENYVSATKTSEADGEDVNKSLIAIRDGLKNIPTSMLVKIRISTGYSIHLVKELPGGQNGLAVFSPRGSQRIILDIDNRYQSRILYHETFHLIERNMYWENGGKDPFSKWDSYNPDDFIWNVRSEKYTFYDSTDTPLIDRVFVTKYAQISAMEDRAELFADLIFRTRKYYYMEDGYGINEKAKYLSTVIDEYFGPQPTASWNKWISW